MKSLEDSKDPVRAFNDRNVRTYKYDEARALLRTFKSKGLRILRRKRSAHGSDCNAACEDGGAPEPTMGTCRCMRVLRLRVDGSGDWLLLFGDVQEGFKVQLQGPYHHDTALAYGGGFWCRVEV